MKFIVKKADIEKDRELLLELIRANRVRENFPYDKRYDWLYYNNPYGKAITWVIWDADKNIPAGFTAVYPRKMLVKQKEYLCWNCGDFSINKEYRTLGVAVKLRKAAKEQVDNGNVPFLYAHPNERMVHIHLRAGHKKIARMKRYALPLRISKYINRLPGGKIAGAAVDPLVSGLLRTKFRQRGDYQVMNPSQMNFDDSFRQICDDLNARIPVVGLRDREYLIWKYKEHFLHKPTLFTYYERSKFVGYIVYLMGNETLSIMEFVASRDDVQKRLLSTFVHHAITDCPAVSVISLVIQEYNPLVPVLLDSGFKYRDDVDSDVIAYTAQPDLREIIHEGKNWFMTVGDRDS